MTDYKVNRGLAKIMAEYIEAEPPAEVDAEQIRKQVFAIAAQSWPLARRTDLLFERSVSECAAEIAGRLGVEPDRLDAAL
ncbi:MAG: DUF790 family protein [Armatimonadota bacterium]